MHSVLGCRKYLLGWVILSICISIFYLLYSILKAEINILQQLLLIPFNKPSQIRILRQSDIIPPFLVIFNSPFWGLVLLV